MRAFAIRPDGYVMALDGSGHDAAFRVFGTASEVITCGHPYTRVNGGIHVMWVGDWSATDGSALNRKAWFLYGGSPVYGIAVVASDTGGDVTHLFDYVSHPDYPGEAVDRVMNEWLAVNRSWDTDQQPNP